jgi:UDP-2,3-diacylglucosamine hydrolase
MDTLGLVAGNGRYPFLLAEAARLQGVSRIVVAGFEGDTDPRLAAQADVFQWFRLGQLGKLIRYFTRSGVQQLILAGQITPSRLYDLKPDWKALWLLARLKERNAETIFGALCAEFAQAGLHVLPATTYLENQLAPSGLIAGPKLTKGQRADVKLGFRQAKAIAQLDIGQGVIVRRGTVLAVEGFDGTNALIERGGRLGRGHGILVKVSKPRQDFRFDVPVIGLKTVQAAQAAGLKVIACEAKKTLLLEREELIHSASASGLSVVALTEEEATS